MRICDYDLAENNYNYNHMKQNLQARTNQRLLPFAVMLLLSLLAIQLSAQISGTVWKDLPVNGAALNTYGVKDANELGVEGVTVTAFPGGMSTTTLPDGTYSLATGAGTFRIEFTWPTKTWLQSSPDAAVQNTSVMFVTAPVANVDFGLFNPADHASSFPRVATVRHIPGLADNNGIRHNAIISFDYNASGASPVLATEASKANVGSAWGVAYSKTRQELYVASFFRRHSGLGPGGLGAVYSVDVTAAQNASVLTTLAAGTEPAVRGLSGETNPSNDFDAFGLVGRIGLGDIDISEDEKFLYVTNLFDKRLYKIDINTQAVVGSFLIPDPLCTNGEFRPFAVTCHEGKVYVGGVCDGSTGDRPDLQAYIYIFDPVTSMFGGSVLDFPLDYIRGGGVFDAPSLALGEGYNERYIEHGNKWYAWENTYDINEFNGIFNDPTKHKILHSQPLFSDIEFDDTGAMILGFSDLTGYQLGTDNYVPDASNSTLLTVAFAGGDILRATLVSNQWQIENHVTAAGAEYFTGDFFNTHNETSNGGLAILLGSNELFLTSLDPNELDSGGVLHLDQSTGGKTNALKIWDGLLADGGVGKASGMGDIELLSDPAPIEIGNLVWDDADGNGEQDADELGIANVTVELYNAAGTTLLATAVTDANGNYIFSNDPNGTAFVAGASHVYQLATLKPNTAYVLKVPTTNGGNNLTTANGAGGKDSIDSDANTGTGEATVLATDIPVLGANNHTFDFGYSAVPPCPPTRCGTISAVKN